jgi:hypothetical protein
MAATGGGSLGGWSQLIVGHQWPSEMTIAGGSPRRIPGVCVDDIADRECRYLGSDDGPGRSA